ncbi:MAG: TonB-dependent receptor [Chitinophagaceae bacterium]|nr:MAG: TonB-dependent receptor [Chitinophagaceae bacterium]
MNKFLMLMACLLACRTSFAQNLNKPSAKVDTAKAKSPAINQLKSVNIEAKKPFVEHRADKTILNVENSILASGGTALEVLEKAPGVSIDRQNEQIRLNNKGGITVLIDGKPTILSGADLTTMLSNMSSEQIGTIEIITNPSAKYDAAGNAGIINIKLKRNKNFGTNGTLAANVSQGLVSGFPADLYRTGLSLNLNHRVAKWNVYGNASFSRKASYNQIAVTRSTLSNGLSSTFAQNFGRTNKGAGYAGKFGVDYYFSPKTTIGVMVDANTVNAKMGFSSATFINELNGNSANSSSLGQESYSKSPATNLTANLNIKHDFKKEGATLTFDMDYSGFGNERDEDFDTKYLNAVGQLDHNSILRNNTDSKISVYAAKTDFAWPLSKSANLEAGLKSSYVETKNDFLAELLERGTWKTDLGKSNQFIYKENINAAYVNLARKWKNFEVQAGFSVTDNKEVLRNYISLFPTVFVNQQLDKNNNIRYSFGRRVDRPSYQQLNPFIFYLDPYTLDNGNPYLKPMFTNNFEIGYTYKDAFTLSVNYSDTRDLIVQITQQNDATRIISLNKNNIGCSENYATNLSFPLNVAKWWAVQNTLGAYWMKVSDGNLLGGTYNRTNLGYTINTSSSIRLPNNFGLEANFWLNSPNLNGQEQSTKPRYALNLGAQKSILNKKMRLRATIEDLFMTNQFAGKIVYQNLDLRIQNRSTSRRAVLSVSYGFGNQNVKSARQRKTATDDIKGRAASN